MSEDKQLSFVQLLVKHQSQLYRFILTMAPQYADAEDLLQQTSVTLWEKWSEYDMDKPFLPWAYGIAKNHVRNFIRKKQRRGEYQGLSEELLSQLSKTRELHEVLLEKRLGALSDCMHRLPDRQRNLLETFYDQKLSADHFAEHLKMSRRSFYRLIQRLRQGLLDCITLNMRRGELK